MSQTKSLKLSRSGFFFFLPWWNEEVEWLVSLTFSQSEHFMILWQCNWPRGLPIIKATFSFHFSLWRFWCPFSSVQITHLKNLNWNEDFIHSKVSRKVAAIRSSLMPHCETDWTVNVLQGRGVDIYGQLQLTDEETRILKGSVIYQMPYSIWVVKVSSHLCFIIPDPSINPFKQDLLNLY